MSEFDPYYKWLGIPPDEQPADYYRLLGVSHSETDSDVIEAAADQKMTYVQRCATGPHVAISQEILNELSTARLCLLSAEKRAAYDRSLEEQQRRRLLPVVLNTEHADGDRESEESVRTHTPPVHDGPASSPVTTKETVGENVGAPEDNGIPDSDQLARLLAQPSTPPPGVQQRPQPPPPNISRLHEVGDAVSRRSFYWILCGSVVVATILIVAIAQMWHAGAAKNPQVNDPQSVAETIRPKASSKEDTPLSRLRVVPIANQTVKEGETLSVFVKLDDNVPNPPDVVFYLPEQSPPTATLNSSTGEFRWTPGETDGPDRHLVLIRARVDGQDRVLPEIHFTINVLESNQPPVVDPIADKRIKLGDSFRLKVIARDPDRPSTPLSYRFGPLSPTGLEIDSNTGLMTWNRESQTAGTHTIRVVVSDNGTPELLATRSFKITVASTSTVAKTSPSPATKKRKTSNQSSKKPILITNGSFERGNKSSASNWRFDVRNGNATHRRVDIAKNGRHSVLISSSNGAWAGWSYTGQLRADSQYRLLGWIKTSKVRARSGSGVKINVYDLNGNFLGGTRNVTGTRDWTLQRATFQTGSGGDVRICCELGNGGKANGIVWFDGLEAEFLGTASPSPSYALDFVGSQHVAVDYKYSTQYPITIEAIVTPSRTSAQTIIGNYQHSGLGLEINDRGFWAFSFHDGQSYVRADSMTAARVSRKVHLAGVFDPPRIRLFLDGQLQRSMLIVTKRHKASSFPFMLGADPNADGLPEHFFSGKIHSVRISRTARYQEEFSPPMRLTPDSVSVVALPIDEGTGNYVRDGSANNHHGVIRGATWVKD